MMRLLQSARSALRAYDQLVNRILLQYSLDILFQHFGWPKDYCNVATNDDFEIGQRIQLCFEGKRRLMMQILSQKPEHLFMDI
jgi:hypothetical protein